MHWPTESGFGTIADVYELVGGVQVQAVFDSIISLKSPDRAFLLSIAKRLKEAGNHGIGFYSPLSAISKQIGAHTLMSSLPSLLDDTFRNMDDKKASAAGALIVTLCKLSRDEMAYKGCTPQVSVLLFFFLLLSFPPPSLSLSLWIFSAITTISVASLQEERERGEKMEKISFWLVLNVALVRIRLFFFKKKNRQQEGRELWTATWMRHIVNYMHHKKEAIRRRSFRLILVLFESFLK